MLVACGAAGDAGPASPSEPAAPTETETSSEAASGDGEVQSSMTVGTNNPNYATQLAIYVALDQGFFEEVGITDVENITTDEYVAGLIGGTLKVAQGDTDVVFGSAAASGEPLKYIGTYRDIEYQIVGVGPDIEDPQDLVGTQVSGGDPGSRNEVVLEENLREMGLNPEEDVEFVGIGGGSDERLQALLQGQVSATGLFPRHRAALEDAGGQFIFEKEVEVPQEGLAAMGPWLEENHDTAVAYLTAHIKALQWLMDNMDKRDEVIAMMREQGFEIPDEFVELYEIELGQISADAGFDVEEMDKYIAELKEIGSVPEDLEWRDHVNLDPLWEAQEANGLERRPDPESL